MAAFCETQVKQKQAVDEGLLTLIDRMMGDVHIEDVLRHAAGLVAETLESERATIYRVADDTQELVSAVVVGNVARTIRVPVRASSLAGYCAMSRRAFLVPDAYGDLSGIDLRLSFDPKWDVLNTFRTRDVMCAPMLFGDRVLGVVQAINGCRDVFDEMDLDSLQQISKVIGYALYHAELYDDMATLKALDKQKAEFMRVLVHELKSPVAASKMFASALRFTAKDEPKIVDVVSKIEKRMDQLLLLVSDILELSKVKAGAPLGRVGVLDLGNETRIGCRPYEAQADGKGLTLKIQVPDAPVPVRFDVRGYYIVVSNLVSNAIKYTEMGSVSVVLTREDDRARLEVQDSGMGIPAADIPNMFKEFYRASNARQSSIEGSGVGLAAVKQLVERFGGEMTLDSEEGKGSVFRVSLPIDGEGQTNDSAANGS